MSSEAAQGMAERFDHQSAEQMQNPYPIYEALRTQCPFGHSAQHGGFYLATRYETVKKVLEDYSSFSSTDGVGIPPHPYKMFPIDLDPPLQTKFRRILNKRFAPETVAAKRPIIERLVNQFIDGFIERGEADFAADLVRPLLPAVVLPILGVPLEDQKQVAAWIDFMTRGRAIDLQGVAKAGEDIGMYLMGLIARRRGQPPIDDIIGLLLESKIDDKPFSDEDVFRTLLIILFGGLDTTSAVMLESLLFLARNPGDKARLVSGEASWDIAIEEFIRYTTPVQGLRRTVTREVEIEGKQLKKGDWVFALHASANRDAAVFANPDQCLLDRNPNPHVAFSSGAHVCLGRYLARLEIEILLGIVLDRLGDYTVAADFEPEFLTGEARGMKALPVRFTPGKRIAA